MPSFVAVALACIIGLLRMSSAHSLLEANASAVDNDQLSSYLRAPSKQCTPGPKLSKWQAPPLQLPFVPFVTLTEAHSGSTWFRTMLNSHPCVRSHGETLRKRTDLKDLWDTLSRPTKTDDPRAVRVPLYAAGLKGFFTPTGGSGTNKRGEAADKSRHDFNPSNKEVFNPVAKFLKESKVGVVIWLRRDPFDRFLSFAREAQIGHPHCQAKMDCDVEKVRTLSYTLPLTKMVTFLDEAKKNDLEAEAMLKRLGVPVLEVKYEDLIGDEKVAAAWWSTVLQFIGISAEDASLLNSEWRRQIVRGHKEVVANYAEVAAKLKAYKGGLYLHHLR